MKLLTKNFFISLSIILFIGISSCTKDEETEKIESSPELQLRIMNGTGPISGGTNLIDGPITVTILPNESEKSFDGYKTTVNFAKLEKGQTSEYKRVSNRFTVKVNEKLIENETFGINGLSSNKWTLKIISKQSSGNSFVYGWDLSIN